MARCDEGYICEVCGEAVDEMVDSDLYLRYIMGLVSESVLTQEAERHIRCNPVQAQFIVHDDFDPVSVDGPFDKRELDPDDVRREDERVTTAWVRLQAVIGSETPVSEYPLK